mmetsp:Transcript_18736/g.58249  ORF Transcript_18736/g.58249 Transcript_18736/m.58249 type:complete len:200 (+) Transcript_18736:1890-2489(+)
MRQVLARQLLRRHHRRTRHHGAIQRHLLPGAHQQQLAHAHHARLPRHRRAAVDAQQARVLVLARAAVHRGAVAPGRLQRSGRQYKRLGGHALPERAQVLLRAPRELVLHQVRRAEEHQQQRALERAAKQHGAEDGQRGQHVDVDVARCHLARRVERRRGAAEHEDGDGARQLDARGHARHRGLLGRQPRRHQARQHRYR